MATRFNRLVAFAKERDRMGKLNRIKNNEIAKPVSKAVVNHWSKGPNAEAIRKVLSIAASKRVGELSPRFGKTKETNPAFSNAGAPKGTVPYNKGNGEYLTPEARERVNANNRGKTPLQMVST